MGKGSSQPSTTTQNVNQNTIPDEFMPYFNRLLGRTEAQSLERYQPYGGQRLADPTRIADINTSRDMTRSLAASRTPGVAEAQGMTRTAGQGILGLAGQDPFKFSQYGGFQAGQASPYAGFTESRTSPYAGFAATRGTEFGGFKERAVSPFSGFSETQGRAFGGFQAGQAQPFSDFRASSATPFSEFQTGQATPFSDFSEAGYNQFQFGPAGQFTGSGVGQYMDPYMQNVVDVEKRRAQEDYDIARQGRSARAVSAGAFGGSRAAVQEGLAERDLLERQGAIQSRGLSTAYGDASRLFEADRAARMATEQAQAGEGARVQTGIAGEAARVQQARAAELARTQGIGIEEAARVQQARAAELARTQGIGIEEAARVQQAQAAELARAQGINIDEAARVQQAQAGEQARIQGMSQEEAARVQQARAAELARTQGIGVDEAARVQQAQASEAARVQGMSQEEQARIQQGQAAELARTQGIGVDEAARVQQARAAELARTQGISIDEAARVQAAQAGELARVQGAQAGEDRAAGQFDLDAYGRYAAQAQQLAGLSEQERAAQIQNAQLLDALGQSQRRDTQAGLDIGYQDYLRQQGYPEEGLGFYSDVLRGLPVADAGSSTSTNYAFTNPAQQTLGAGLSALSLYRAYQ